MILHHLSAVLHPGVSTVKADLQCLKLIHPENCLEHVDVSKVPPYLKKNTLPIATHGKIDFLFTHEFSRLGSRTWLVRYHLHHFHPKHSH